MLSHKIYRLRMLVCAVLACVAMAALSALSPQQAPVVLYKLTLVLLAGVAGYWLDRWVYPYSRPDGYLRREWRDHSDIWPDDLADYEVTPGYETVFAVALLRRAIIIGCAMLAVGLGL